MTSLKIPQHNCLIVLDNLHQILDGDFDDNVFDNYNDLFVLVAGLCFSCGRFVFLH